MAKNMFKKYTESLTREVEVGANVAGGSAVIVDGRAAVTLADAGGTSKTVTSNLPGALTSVSYTDGGVGYKDKCAVVAFDGSWLFPVTGVKDGETVPNSAGTTARGSKVYAVVASGKVTSLTLTGTGNTYFGIIDDGNVVGGVAPVQIGVPA